MVWKSIKNFEGMYEVSENGDIKSLTRKVASSRSSSGFRTVRERILKQHIDRYGYACVTLRKEGRDFGRTVHRLVASAFLENPDNLPSINHIDEDKLNNHYSNLEWCTVQHNNNYNDRQLRIGEVQRKKGVNGIPVSQYDLEGNHIQDFVSGKAAASDAEIHKNAVYQCCKGLRESAGGYIWKYTN